MTVFVGGVSATDQTLSEIVTDLGISKFARALRAVTDFDAVGNGTTNNTTNFQNANQAAADIDGVVTIPEGSFALGGTVFSNSDTSWAVWGGRVLGPGQIDADGDASVLQQGQSNLGMMRAMFRDTNESTLYVSAVMQPANAGVVIPGQPNGYQKNGIYVAVLNRASNGTNEAKDATGISVKAQMAPDTPNGTIWGYHAQVIVPSTSDSYALSAELELNNSAVEQTEVNQTNSKNGIHIVAKGSSNSTAGIFFNSWNGPNGKGVDYVKWTDGIVVSENSVSRHAFAVRRIVGLAPANHVNLCTIGVDGRGTFSAVDVSGMSTSEAAIRNGVNRTDNGASIVDLFSSVSPALGFDFRILRNAGANGSAEIINAGTGATNFVNAGAGQFNWFIDGTARLTLATIALAPISDNALSLGTVNLRYSRAHVRSLEIGTTPGTEGVFYLSGAGTPEGVITANVGSIYTRTDGGAGTTLYVKESGTGNTGWVAK